MATEEQIRLVLGERNIEPLGPLIADSESGPRYFISVVVSRDSKNRQVPSNRRLHDCTQALAAVGVTAQFLLRDAEALDLEVGLRATILHSNIEDVRNVFLSMGKDAAHVWVEPKRVLDDEKLEAMAERARQFLQLVGVNLGSLNTTSGASLPSKLACMTAIRLLAPATLTSLESELSRRGFSVPSPSWLTKRLDALRKAGSVVRLRNGSYTLARKSLHALGSAKSARSPDLTRLLALARRGELR